MRRHLFALAACFATTLAAQADNAPVVVELFTSQGCSSCPPADDMMHQLAARDDVIALSLHVDYWDYIGWKDEFADPRHAQRQRTYATLGGRRSVYTPEMIVNGESDIVGARPLDLAMAIEAHKERPKSVEILLQRRDDALTVTATPLRRITGPVLVQIFRYQPERVAKITRGENAGRTITYVNVAQDWQVLDTWNGRDALRFEAEVTGDMPGAIVIQSEKDGRILAAARLP